MLGASPRCGRRSAIGATGNRACSRAAIGALELSAREARSSCSTLMEASREPPTCAGRSPIRRTPAVSLTTTQQDPGPVKTPGSTPGRRDQPNLALEFGRDKYLRGRPIDGFWRADVADREHPALHVERGNCPYVARISLVHLSGLLRLQEDTKNRFTRRQAQSKVVYSIVLIYCLDFCRFSMYNLVYFVL